MKWRNSKERELLASGGSREQTLPNKNNPNPDLSDADSDKPKIDLSDLSPLHSPANLPLCPSASSYNNNNNNNNGSEEMQQHLTKLESPPMSPDDDGPDHDGVDDEGHDDDEDGDKMIIDPTDLSSSSSMMAPEPSDEEITVT